MTPTDLGAGPPLPERATARAERALAATRANGSSDHELEWIREIAEGDRLAFEQLFRTYSKRLFGYLFRMVGRADAAEELTNDVMVAVWKGAADFKGESRLSTWIFGIAHFRAVSWLRRTRPELVDIEDAGPIQDSHELPEEMLLKESTREQVRRALARLTPGHRAVIELTFYQEFSYPEIAAIVGCPVNTVKTRMFYARKQLREVLMEGAHP